MPVSTRLQLLEPSLVHLPGYAEALARGWSPNNVRDVSAEQLDAIRENQEAFVVDLLSQTGTVRLPDGIEIPRLPNRVRWMWDGAFTGHIGLRWQPGTDALPDHVLGHIGFAVVPWKRRRGYASQALAHDAADGARGRPEPGGDHHRHGQQSLAAGDRVQWRPAHWRVPQSPTSAPGLSCAMSSISWADKGR